MIRPALVLLVATGCRQLFGIDEVVSVDAGTDPPADVADASATPCYGTEPLRLCFDSEPQDTLMLSGTIDVDVGCPLVVLLDGREACVFAARDVVFAGTTTLTGARPVVIVASATIAIDANVVVDVSSSTGRRGAGSEPAECHAPSQAGLLGGGAGGSFRDPGGNGGAGNNGSAMGGVAGMAAPVAFRGGCRGGESGGASAPGSGGGALYLIASTLQLDGVILANGGGGRGGANGPGGTGGGSGGYVGLDAATVNFASGARVLAVGGGGGGGSCFPSLGGQNGGEADGISVTGVGGLAGGSGGNGGSGGGVTPAVAGAAGGSSCSGGGGGGGAGAIQVFGGAVCPDGRCFPQP